MGKQQVTAQRNWHLGECPTLPVFCGRGLLLAPVVQNKLKRGTNERFRCRWKLRLISEFHHTVYYVSHEILYYNSLKLKKSTLSDGIKDLVTRAQDVFDTADSHEACPRLKVLATLSI